MYISWYCFVFPFFPLLFPLLLLHGIPIVPPVIRCSTVLPVFCVLICSVSYFGVPGFIVREDKWERKEYITTCHSALVKGIIKIRLHMWELKKNYPREEEDTKCPICKQKEDTKEHVLECQTAETVYKIRNNTPNQWAEIVKLYRQNKELRK